MVGLGVFAVIRGDDATRDLFDRFDDSLAAAAVFALLYALLTVVMTPGTVGTLAAGALFGFVTGFAVVMVGATLGALAAFGVGRRLGRDAVQTLAGPRLREIDEWLGRNGFTAMLTMRLLPIFPFNALNYAAGLSSLRFRSYALATVLGIIPGVAVFVSLGRSARDPSSPAFVAAATAAAVMVAGSGVIARRLQAGRASEQDATG